MRHGNLTRAEAEARCGTEIVSQLSYAHVEPTDRVQTDGDTDVEFAASLGYVEWGRCRTVTAYYYQSPEAVATVIGLDELTWEVAGYEIV